MSAARGLSPWAATTVVLVEQIALRLSAQVYGLNEKAPEREFRGFCLCDTCQGHRPGQV